MSEIQMKIQKCRKIVEEIESDTVRSIACLSIWKRANGAPDIQEKYNDTYEARALGMIHDSLHISLVIALMRMYDNDKKSASIPALINLFKSNELIGALKNLSNAQRTQIDTWLKELDIHYNDTKEDITFLSLKNLRNHVLSHIDQNKSKIHGAKYGQEEKLLNRTIPIVRLLLLIVKSEEVDFSEYKDDWDLCSDRFWKSVTIN